MRNVKWIFVVLLSSAFFFLSFVEEGHHAEGLNEGDIAPTFIARSLDGTTKSIQNEESNYVLVSFWASYDAASRMNNVACSNEVKRLGNKVALVSVSFDEFESVVQETVKHDKIDIPNCYVELKGEDSELFKTYRLAQGFGNYLLDSDGVIIAKNILPSDIQKLIN
ncbi:MAG: thioredoxin family protein [Bacteroidaceae bacterium]|nr:thioredoxin family protein [Candidatus Minthousia equi]MCQ2245429.1 thioredoxin family protein [Bacteroidaceae bacterium]MDO4956468.1 thioredoxin family protein [Bacteroidales bacterium]